MKFTFTPKEILQFLQCDVADNLKLLGDQTGDYSYYERYKEYPSELHNIVMELSEGLTIRFGDIKKDKL